MLTMSAREAAFLAVWEFIQKQTFALVFLEHWQSKFTPKSDDFGLAQEIAYGTIRMALALDYIAGKLADRNKLSLKGKEKSLLRTALYQRYFMSKIPLYAIGNEMGELSKKYTHTHFSKFLNAILRKSENTPLVLPQGNSPQNLSIRYSYPIFFVEVLLKDYDATAARNIMERGNISPIIMARVRKDNTTISLKDWEEVKKIASSSDYYIQNATPVHLLTKLSEKSSVPKKILDLCASPGGKLLAAFDFFKEAKLFANDVTQDKIEFLKKNCDKYGIKASISCCKGEKFSTDEKFDLIILDVPCSNTGVLNKRPEARWRLSKESIEEQQILQKELLTKAKDLLSVDGQIWYMTCSILKKENEEIIHWATTHLGMQSLYQETIFPNLDGYDGGFASLLKASK